MTDETAIPATESDADAQDTRESTRTPTNAVAGDSEALVQQIAEAIDSAPDSTDPVTGDWRDWVNEARAVLPLVEAQVAPLRDEVERTHWAEGKAWEMVTAAESALRQVRESVSAEADWLNAHHDGSLVTSDYPMIARRIRDVLARVGAASVNDNTSPEMPANEAKTNMGAADTQPEGAGEARWCACGHAEDAHISGTGLCAQPYEDGSGVGGCYCYRFTLATSRREAIAAAIYRLNGQALYGRDLGEFDGDRMEAERWRWLEQANLVLAAMSDATPTAGSKVDTAPEGGE